MLSVSNDGYIRVTLLELQGVHLIHLLSALDEESAASTHGASQASITGYTEWQSASIPRISIGWDWEMIFVDNRVQLDRIGEPRSNLMLQDMDHKDLGYKKSMLLQGKYIDGLKWQLVVREQINMRYR